jgi:hypothetical protein
MSCWLPYDFSVIMRFGHTVNTNIPEDPDQAEFPPTPWGNNVMIRVKSQSPPVQPVAPLPAGDGSCEPPPAPGLPLAWTGPALRQAPPISAAAVAFAGYHSPNQTIPADPNEPEEPPDPDLLRLRGVSNSDEDYPIWIGISLPIRDLVGEEFHEGICFLAGRLIRPAIAGVAKS